MLRAHAAGRCGHQDPCPGVCVRLPVVCRARGTCHGPPSHNDSGQRARRSESKPCAPRCRDGIREQCARGAPRAIWSGPQRSRGGHRGQEGATEVKRGPQRSRGGHRGQEGATEVKRGPQRSREVKGAAEHVRPTGVHVPPHAGPTRRGATQHCRAAPIPGGRTHMHLSSTERRARTRPRRCATVRNGPKRSETIQNDPKRSETIRNDPKRSETIRNDPKRSEGVQSPSDGSVRWRAAVGAHLTRWQLTLSLIHRSS